jgi:hypothetical protein
VSDFAPHIGLVAKAVWGEPNARLSTRHDMRFGTNGSKSVDLRKGVWRDHETDEGGGVLDLLRIMKGLTTAGAFKFLEELGVHMPRRDEPQPSVEYNRGKIVATYDYHDANGEVLFQVVRLDPKDFRQRKPDGSGGWEWGAKGVPLVPYRLPELIEDLAADRRVFVVEGEKAVDYLRAHGIPATTNPMGAKKWRAETSQWFTEAEVVIVRDNDKTGREHGDLVAESIKGVASSILILDPPGVPEKAGLDDWLAANSVEALEGMLKANAYEPGKAPFKSRYGALWLHELANASTKMAWVVKGVVPAHSFGGVVGEPSCGKSFLALDLAFTTGVLARSEADWFGHKCLHGGVVYLAAEGQQGFIKRVKALLNRHQIDPDPTLPFVLLPTAVDLRSAEGDTDGLIKEIQAHASRMPVPLSLVFVDTLNRAMGGGDENASEDMGAFIRSCDRIREQTGATVVVVHHLNAAGTRERGHTSFKGALDFMLTVERGDMGKSWKITKQKDGEDGEQFAFALQSVLVGVDDDGDDITSCIVHPSEKEVAQRTSRKLSTTASLAYRLLVDCTNDHGRGVPLDGLRNQCGVKIEEFRDYCKRNNFTPPDGPPNSFYHKFSRSLDSLREANRIGVSGDWVWVPR